MNLAALSRAYGIGRSLAMYYAQIWRWSRIDTFYSQFISPGDLCFDVGAHVGNRVRSWLRLGGRVVAIEPQPDFHRLLQWFYGRRSEVTLLRCGLGDTPGTGEMRVSTRTPTVSTLSQEWIDDVTHDPRFAQIDWNERVDVDIETLDRLIDRFGEPAFCKVDVEGYEQKVLDGLSRPVRAISFEYIPIARDRAAACVDKLCSLGDYGFCWSAVETMRWGTDRWMSANEIKEVLARMPDSAGSGDIYALARSAAADT